MPPAARAPPGQRSSRPVSAARTMVASRDRGRRRQTELLDHHVERTEFAAMTPEHVFDIERNGVEALADRDNLGRRHEQKHRVRIDEAPDQPGAGDAVDLRPRAGHPDGAALGVARRQFRCRHQRQFGGLPALEAALERLRPSTWRCRSQAAVPWASFWPRRQTTMADLPANSSPQSAAASWLRLTAPGIEPRIGGKVLVGAHVDQGRHIRRADQPGKFLR